MTLQELYGYLYETGSVPENDSFIKICENNLHVIKSVVPKTLSIDDYARLCKIHSDYAIILGQKEYYSQAISEQNIALLLWENHPELPMPLVDIELYELLRFYRAVGYYYTNQLDKCDEEFSFLALTYPRNEKYRTWLKAGEKKKFSKYQNIIGWGVVAIILIKIIVLPDNIYNRYLVNSIYAGAILTLIILEIKKRRK